MSSAHFNNLMTYVPSSLKATEDIKVDNLAKEAHIVWFSQT